MKRGPNSNRGFKAAIPVALLRGCVMRFLSAPFYICDIMIVEDGRLSVVRIRMAQKLRGDIASIAIEFSDSIRELGRIPGGGPVSRELWLYNRHGSLRFFRITDAGLVEIDRYGIPFVNGKPVVAGPAPAVAGNTVSPVPDAGQIRSADDEPHLAIIRWMAKRNACENPAGGKIPALSQVDPGNNPGSLVGKPDPGLPAADGSTEGPGPGGKLGAGECSHPGVPGLSPVPGEKGKVT